MRLVASDRHAHYLKVSTSRRYARTVDSANQEIVAVGEAWRSRALACIDVVGGDSRVRLVAGGTRTAAQDR
jgi:hypothetical protein